MKPMGSASHPSEKLTKNQAKVLQTLYECDKPMSAYSILDQLRDVGFRAPLQVYRALEKLVETGKVHRLESLNAFVACRHPSCNTKDVIAFTICEDCGEVDEISDNNLSQQLKRIAGKSKFGLRRSVIELRGSCQSCKSLA